MRRRRVGIAAAAAAAVLLSALLILLANARGTVGDLLKLGDPGEISYVGVVRLGSTLDDPVTYYTRSDAEISQFIDSIADLRIKFDERTSVRSTGENQYSYDAVIRFRDDAVVTAAFTSDGCLYTDTAKYRIDAPKGMDGVFDQMLDWESERGAKAE